MPRDLVILGSSGQAREIALYVDHVNASTERWRLLGFVSADPAERGRNLGAGLVLGDDDWLLSQDIEADLLVGVGHPHVKMHMLERYLRHGDRFQFPNLVHPRASLDLRHVTLGRGNVVAPGVAMTCDITVGDFNLFNQNVTVGHDAVVGSFNVVNPGANISGGVVIEDGVLVGVGAQILEKLRVRRGSTVGAGAVVRVDVEEGETVVGIPARPIRRGNA